MAAYYKVDVSLNTNAVEVGLPSPQTVNVTIPLVGPAGPQGPAGSGGGGDVESVNGQTGVVVLAPADIGAVASNDARLTDARTPTSHTHGNLSNAGAIGTTANLPVKTGTSGVLEAGAFGTSAGQFAEGNDTRIATIASGSITTADGGGSIDTRGTGSIGLGVTGTRTTLTGTATANRALSLPNASGTLALSPAETYYNITATSIGSPQQIDLSASPFTEATEVRSVLNNDTGIVYVQILLPIDAVSIVPKFRFYGQIGGAGDILNIQLIRDSVVVFPASGSGYEELNDGETLEVVWNGTAYGLTPNAPFMRRITLPNASGTLALTSDFAAPPAIGNTTPAAISGTTGTFTTLTANSGAVATNNPALSVSQTWNGAGQTFVAAEVVITRVAQSTNSAAFRVRDSGGSNYLNVDLFGTTTLGFTRINGLALTNNSVVQLFSGGTNILEQVGGTSAQTFNIYGTQTSSTNYQRLTIKTKAVTLSALSGASVATTTGLIPDGAVLVGLTTRVSTAITGATGYDIGDGTDADRWGANIGFALNTSSDNTNWTAGTIECFTAAQEVTLTAVGSNFTGGAVVIVAHYLAGEAD